MQIMMRFRVEVLAVAALLGLGAYAGPARAEPAIVPLADLTGRTVVQAGPLQRIVCPLDEYNCRQWPDFYYRIADKCLDANGEIDVKRFPLGLLTAGAGHRYRLYAVGKDRTGSVSVRLAMAGEWACPQF